MKSADKPTVLVVDDEQMTADTLAAILKLNGFDSHALYSGESAVEWLETNRPDIILADVKMRHVSGVDTAVRVRELHPECRIILFTAASLSTSNRHTIQRLGFELLDRPLHPRELLARLRDPEGSRVRH
ncbi:MAG TPA: response regulator [Terracidiphilus sp.]|jgi:DNA-binding response OmpR family regulator|nr:response regulator [Terracidiphilus sp.]